MSFQSYPGKSSSEQSNNAAFAVLLKNGGVMAWGSPDYGGDISRVASQLSSGVVEIYSNYHAFAAIKSDGSVVAWGDAAKGGSAVGQLQSNVLSISSTDSSFAALKSDGSVVIWGKNVFGTEQAYLQGSINSGAISVSSTESSFAILKSDGSVATWGSKTYGGKQEEASGANAQSVESLLTSGVERIRSTGGAFAAIKTDGSVVAWGNYRLGGDIDSGKKPFLTSDIQEVYSNYGAFAALKNDGSVVSWGYAPYGGNSSSVESSLTGGVKSIASTFYAFAAIKENGNVVTWGSTSAGGDSSSVAGELTSVKSITASFDAFAALREDGSVVTWGNASSGGDSSAVRNQLVGVKKIVSGRSGAFAALKSDGTVVTWGLAEGGGDSAGVQSLLINVVDIRSNGGAFAALRQDGSVVTWGNTIFGGSTAGNEIRFNSGVAGISNVLTELDRILVDVPPADLSITASAFDENIAVGSAVGTLSSTDANAGDTFTYSLVSGTGDTDNAAFTIDGAQLKINASPDYETMSSYSIRLQTTDSGGLILEKEFTLNVTDLNEVPTALNLSATSFNENIASVSAVATLSSTDPDADDSFSYALVSGTGATDNDAFTIDGDQLRIKESPDFESKSSYSIRLQTTDSGGLTLEKEVTLNVADIPELLLPTTTTGTKVTITDTSSPEVVTTSQSSPDLIEIQAPVTATLNALTTERYRVGLVARNVGTTTNAGTGQNIPLRGLGKYTFVATAIPEATTIINLEPAKDTAFFLHDAFSAFYEGLMLTADSTGRQSHQRVLNVDTIVMGSGGGTSIVDLTSKDYVTGAVTVYGADKGRSIFWGTDSNDTFISGGGDSVIFGGAGSNSATLGTGRDTLQYRAGVTAEDRIEGFDRTKDVVELWAGKDMATIEPQFSSLNGSTTMTWGSNTVEFVGMSDLTLLNLQLINRVA